MKSILNHFRECKGEKMHEANIEIMNESTIVLSEQVS